MSRIFGEVRTRLLIFFVFTVSGLLLITVPISRRLNVDQISLREQENLEENLASFDAYVLRELGSSENPSTAQLKELMHAFLRSELPEDDNFMISIVDSRFDAASPVALPGPLQPGSPLMKDWETTTTARQGEISTDDRQIGDILFRTQPVVVGGRVRGVFVTAITTGGELQEANDLIGLLTRIFISLLLISLFLTWLLANVVLAPLARLAAATRSIGAHNLCVRLPEAGRGELGDISRSFNTMLDRLEAQITSQKEFLRDAGHELRTPLTVLRGHAELLPQDVNEADRNQTVGLLLDEIDRMSRLVEELSLLANHHTGTVEADPDRLTQCLMNLANNAVCHTGPDDTIEIGSQREADGHFRLWVSDSGSGIEPELQGRIFERFLRGSTTLDTPGAGLGLSIVKAIVTAHRGRVIVDSAPGHGSTFTLLLPSSQA